MNTDSALARWAADVQQVYLVAVSLAKTSFVPASMKGKPEEVTAAILAGGEVGLQQMASLRSIDIIQGTPAMRALTMRGLVQAAGHEVWTKESPRPAPSSKADARAASTSSGPSGRWTGHRSSG
jgi:hypothetical protein